jgi:hypothetical protein
MMRKLVFSYSLVSVCRVETYRIKSTIHHTLRRKTVLLENMWRKDSCAG